MFKRLIAVLAIILAGTAPALAKRVALVIGTFLFNMDWGPDIGMIAIVLAGWAAGSAWAATCWLVANWLQDRGSLERGEKTAEL